MISIIEINKINELDLKDPMQGEENIQIYEELYAELIEELRNNILYVEFIKKNGELRQMYCTRNAGYIGEMHKGGYSEKNEESEQTIKKDMKNGLVKVFDTEKDEFRSFSLRSVRYIENHRGI